MTYWRCLPLGVLRNTKIPVTIFFQVVQGQRMKLYQVHYLSVCCVLHFASLLRQTSVRSLVSDSPKMSDIFFFF